MTKNEFYYLYVNLNSLIDLALLNVAADFDGLEDDIVPEQSDSELLETSLDNLDFEAMNGLDFYDPVESNQDPHIPEVSSLPIVPDVEEKTSSTTELAISVDVGAFIEALYSFDNTLVERMDVLFEQLDQKQFAMLINALPVDKSNITAQVNEEEMRSLLQLYLQDDESILNLVLALRQLDLA